MDLDNFLRDILIVIVVYKNNVSQALTRVIPAQYSHVQVFIYDNSPTPQAITGDSIIYQHDFNNPGVSKAYNEAFKKAGVLKKKWMLLLDQDTVLDKNIFLILYQAINANPDKAIFASRLEDSKGVVSPYKSFFGKGIRIRKIPSGVHSFKNFLVINSGMCISVDAFQNAGGYDERFPLDLSDVVFLDRLISFHPEFVLLNVSCRHQLSINDSGTGLNDAVVRFRGYCKAVRLYHSFSKKITLPMLSILPMAIKLLIKHKNAEFLKIAFENPK